MKLIQYYWLLKLCAVRLLRYIRLNEFELNKTTTKKPLLVVSKIHIKRFEFKAAWMQLIRYRASHIWQAASRIFDRLVLLTSNRSVNVLLKPAHTVGKMRNQSRSWRTPSNAEIYTHRLKTAVLRKWMSFIVILRPGTKNGLWKRNITSCIKTYFLHCSYLD